MWYTDQRPCGDLGRIYTNRRFGQYDFWHERVMPMLLNLDAASEACEANVLAAMRR
jgi:hypothetical protein